MTVITGCTCATTGNIVGTYSAGTVVTTTFTTTATGTLTLDGHLLVLNDFVLIKDQTSDLQNGIYQVTTAGDVGVQTVFTRVAWYFNAADINRYGLIDVLNGTLNSNTNWALTTSITTLGTDSIIYALFYKKYGSLGSKYVYVDSNGSDTTGTGTQVAPYATVSHAESVITTATATAPFTIYINGTITDTAISKKPFINWQGVDRNSSYVKFNTFVADASMSVAGSYCSFSNLTFTSLIANPLVLDLSASGFSATATFTVCQLNPNCQFIGPTGAIFLVNIKNGTNVTGTITATDVTLSTITSSFLSSIALTASTRTAAWTSNADSLTSFAIDGNHGFSAMVTALSSTLTSASTANGAGATISYGPYIALSLITLTTGATATAVTSSFTTLNLPTTTSSTVGVVNQNSQSFIHSYGTGNLFFGNQAGNFTLTTGSAKFNTVMGGGGPLLFLTTGASNCGVGYITLQIVTTGSNNTALGTSTLIALTTGSNNIAIGNGSGGNYVSSESSNILLGHVGVAAESNVMRLGTFGSGAGQVNTTAIAGNTTLTSVQNTPIGSTTPNTGAFTTLSATGLTTLSAGQIHAVTPVTGSTYIALTSDYVLACNRSGTIGITLITSPATGRTYRIKDISGAAATNNITITPAAGTIDGASTFVINTNYGSVDLTYNGTSWSIL